MSIVHPDRCDICGRDPSHNCDYSFREGRVAERNDIIALLERERLYHFDRLAGLNFALDKIKESDLKSTGQEDPRILQGRAEGWAMACGIIGMATEMNACGQRQRLEALVGSLDELPEPEIGPARLTAEMYQLLSDGED